MCKDHRTWVSRMTGHSVMPLWSNHSQVFGHGTAKPWPWLMLSILTISIYTSAVASFYVPSDICGIKGMCREWIHASPSWCKGAPHYDTILVETDPEYTGMSGTDVTQVKLFFSFRYEGIEYRCALVDWFSHIGDGPDEDTGMWVVEWDVDLYGNQILQVIHIDTVIQCTHLIGVYGPDPVSTLLTFSDSLYAFHTYYVNKYADHHSFEVAVW